MKNYFKRYWRNITGVLVLIVAVVFGFMQKEAILDSLEALKNADKIYIILAFFSFAITVLAAAGIVFNLKFKKIKFGDMLVVQTAGLFLGRITPASIGAIAAMMRLLVAKKHSGAQATTVVGTAGITTFVGNALISSVALIFALNKINLADFNAPTFMLIAGAVVVVIILFLMTISKIRHKVVGFIIEILKNLAEYKNHKKRVIYAILLGALLTAMYGTTMLLVAYSLGQELTLFAAIITVSLGSLGVAVTPLPGGAVGAEAAIAASLVQFGIAGNVALAIALVYRAVSFWLPLLPGFFASQYALKNKLL